MEPNGAISLLVSIRLFKKKLIIGSNFFLNVRVAGGCSDFYEIWLNFSVECESLMFKMVFQ